MCPRPHVPRTPCAVILAERCDVAYVSACAQATIANQENIVLLYDRQTAAIYARRFEQLWQQYEASASVTASDVAAAGRGTGQYNNRH